MADRASLKAKIAALRAKTKAAGCTEAEALAAAALAAELMAKHGLREADMVMTEAHAYEETEKATWRTKINAIIAYCTNCACIHLTDRTLKGAVCLFVGRNPGPEIAVYLRDVCYRAVKAELKAFKAGTFYRRRRSLITKRAAAADFTDGMVDRLCVRLVELFASSRNDVARTEARNAIAARFQGSVTHARPSREQRFSEAADEGWRAGGKVHLAHGVNDVQSPRRIAP